MNLPTKFIERYASIAPEGFAGALDRGLAKTLRVNSLKGSPVDFQARATRHHWELAPLEFVPGGFAIEREDRSQPLGHSLEHFAGHFYIQEASSMIPPLVLDPQPGERVLDMAAAPGSKTTQLSALMQNQGLLVANDVSIPRIKALSANLERSGCLNVVVTNLAGVRIGRFAAGQFDRVLLDAPCTSEGTLAKSPEAMERWSERSIGKLATIQSKLLIGAYQALKPGGTLVYSTCTFAPEENEGVVSEFLAAHPEASLEAVELPGLPSAPGVTEWQGQAYHPDLAKAARIWPGEHRMEGFFICKLRKPADYPAAEAGKPFADRRFGEVNDDATEWATDHFGWPGWEHPVTVKEKQAERWAMTPEVAEFDALPVVRRGLRMARTVTSGFKPTTDWCQLVGDRFTTHVVETDGEQTSDYLAGQDLAVSADRGYVVMRHDGISYGCGLSQETRIKNQLPTSRRILPRPQIV